MVDFTELIDGLAGNKYPSRGRWYPHHCAPLLLNRTIGCFDTLHEAEPRIRWHSYVHLP